MTDTIVTERPHSAIIRVWHGEDWYDALPQLVDNAGLPFDVTSYTLELFARPTLDHSVLLKLLSSTEGTIRKEDPTLGLVNFYLPQSDVEASLPVGTWEQFFRITWVDELLGEVSKILWTGKIIVFPANDAAA
ncbi:hypothetical protein VQ042_01350 [Aurantimonas sp. A2-1-M11]|uniref:hypothetical protein n=1 Tax=Aurantimonas sp. A2-1-M11 TaxID=3113712 RepID=UPI002F94D84C